MTDLSKLAGEVAAISSSSAKIKAFCADVAGILVDLDKRLTAAEAKAAPAPSPAPTPAPAPSGLPKQGFSNSWAILGRTSANQDRELDACKDLANGKPWWLRLDWWPNDTRWDTVATKARARGATMMGLYNTEYAGRPSITDYAANCAALARKCDLVNVINEPDMNGWPATDTADYMVAAYAAVHAANPNAVVIGPSIWKTQSQRAADAYVYVQAMLTRAAGKKMWDVFDIHLYGRASEAPPANYVGDWWNVWDYVFRNGGKNIKSLLPVRTSIICTEAGSQASVATGGLTGEEYQRLAVAEGMDARSTLGLAGYGVFSVPDDSSPGGFGLKRPDWTSRPAYAEFKARAV